MPLYSYRAVTARGRLESGTARAATPRDARIELSRRGMQLIDVSLDELGDPPRRFRLTTRCKSADIADAFRYLATMVEADLTLDSALELAADATSRQDVRAALLAAREMVRSGTSLSSAFERQESVVPAIAVGIVSVAERTGELAPALLRIADYLEKREQLRSGLVSALSYPVLMGGLGSVSVGILIGYVLPKFAILLTDTGVPLPATTSALVSLGSFLAASWPVLVVILLVLLVGGAHALRTPRGRRTMHWVLLRAPVVGVWRAQHAAIQLGTSLSAMLRAGTPLLDALSLSGDALTDECIREHVIEARERVRSGLSLSAALGPETPLPHAFLQMVRVGEESGTLGQMLGRAATVTESDLSRRLSRAVRLIEPVMILLFGLAIGFVALALLQAVYGIQGSAW